VYGVAGAVDDGAGLHATNQEAPKRRASCS
jgi:hypothetical protein